jgi:xanthosine utilization system XapX-like protein
MNCRTCALVLIFVAATLAWPNQIGACGSPMFYDSYNGTANQHSSEFPSNGSWVLNGFPTVWYPNTQYTITINGSQAGANGTRNSRVRGFLLAFYDNNGVAYGSWSDLAGFAQTLVCGQGAVVVNPDPNIGTPGFKVNSGSVGSHTALLGSLTKVYQYLNVTWTSPPVAANLSLSGVIVSDKIYNSLLPVYTTYGIQGTAPIPTATSVATSATSAAATSTAAAGTSATGTSAAATGTSAAATGTSAAVTGATSTSSASQIASGTAVTFFLSGLFAWLL